MKILRISLRNLASLEGTHTVDFTRDPLRSAGLFSITGATGSGKSTLLDALCLALYEKTPRLAAVHGTVKLPDGMDSISQRDAANLLRRGTAEGFAEVAFTGVDGLPYTARWSVRRARNRPDGSLQNTELALFQGNIPTGTNGAIAQGGKKGEVLAAIVAKVGLTFEQFTRAVLLAQNDFATFLKAADHERAEILQALTGTERFEAISVAVYQRCAGECSAIKDLEARIGGIEPLTEEARREAESLLTQAQAAWSKVQEQIQAREKHLSWFKLQAELASQEKLAADALQSKIASRDAALPRRAALSMAEEASRSGRPHRDAERALQAELAKATGARSEAEKHHTAATTEHTARRALCDEAAKAAENARRALENLKPLLASARELDVKITPLAERHAAAVRERETAEQNAKRATEAHAAILAKRDAAARDQASLTTQRASLAPYVPFVSECSLWLHRLDRVAECGKNLQGARDTAQRKAAEEKKCRDSLARQRAKEADLHKAVALAATAFSQADLKARSFDAEKVAQSRADADAARNALRLLQQQIQETATISGHLATIDGATAQLKANKEREEQARAQLLEKLIPDAERSLDAMRRACEVAEAAVTNEAHRLREKLTPDHPCPVCGALEHPYSAHAATPDTAALRALRQERNEAEKSLQANREKAAQLAASISAAALQISEKGEARKAYEKRLQEIARAPHEHPCAAPILALPAGDQSSAVAARLAAQEKAYADADVADKARRESEKLRDDCRAKLEIATNGLHEFRATLAKLEEQLAGLSAGRQAADTAAAEAETAHATARAELDPIFTAIEGSHAGWENNARSFRENFETATKAVASLDARIHDLSGVIRESEAALTPARDALARLQGDLLQKQADENSAKAAHDEVKKAREQLLSGGQPDAVEAEFAAAIKLAEDAHKARQEEFAANTALLARALEALSAATKNHADLETRHREALARLEDWIKTFASRFACSLDRAQLEVVLSRDEAWFKSERDALDALEGSVREAEGTLSARRKSLADHQAQRPAHDDEAAATGALLALKEDLRKASEHRDHARAALLADDDRIKASAALGQQLQERRAAADPWIKLNELIGSADGAKFRGIVQRRTLDILLGYANAQLELLSSRYRLDRLPDSLNLIVSDKDMGDERRSVHSLSGGESFLVSLGLALGLASLTSNRLRIESLFIDEGFGSLDADTLNTAMGALMRLESQGRKVGVISHVPEMADAIPVQIRVVKGRSGASRLIVPGAEQIAEIGTSRDGSPAEEIRNRSDSGGIAALIVEMLRREKASGQIKVSLRSLRERIGCNLADFTRAREALGDQVILEGRSLSLSE